MSYSFNTYYKSDNNKDVNEFYANYFSDTYNNNSMGGESIYSLSRLLNKIIKEFSLKELKMNYDADKLIEICIKMCDTSRDMNLQVDNEYKNFFSGFSKKQDIKVNRKLYTILSSDNIDYKLKEKLVYYTFCIRRLGNYMPLPQKLLKSVGGSTVNKWKGSGYDDPIQFYMITFHKMISENNLKMKELKKLYNVETYDEFLKKSYIENLNYEIKLGDCNDSNSFIKYISNAIEFINSRHKKFITMELDK